jgi:hypothetical protein
VVVLYEAGPVQLYDVADPVPVIPEAVRVIGLPSQTGFGVADKVVIVGTGLTVTVETLRVALEQPGIE